MTEYAVMRDGEVINVVETTADQSRIEAAWAGQDVTIMPLDSVPLAVKQRYQYWDERP